MPVYPGALQLARNSPAIGNPRPSTMGQLAPWSEARFASYIATSVSFRGRRGWNLAGEYD